jgi:hypothetical protein
MGTGKTNAALWAADWLMDMGRVSKVLVLSPLSTLDRVWKQDIFDTLMHRKCAIVHGSKDKRAAALDADVDFYIMNHDGLADRGARRDLQAARYQPRDRRRSLDVPQPPDRQVQGAREAPGATTCACGS